MQNKKMYVAVRKAFTPRKTKHLTLNINHNGSADVLSGLRYYVPWFLYTEVMYDVVNVRCDIGW